MIDKSNMTPQELFEYKLRWKPGVTVDVHSDLHIQCKDWCRRNMQRWEWGMDTWTYVYSHSYHFETQEKADKFKTEFREWVDKGKT